MSGDFGAGARPTLKVLKEYLNEPSDWGDVNQYRAVRDNRFRDAGPLADLDHPVIRSGSWLNEAPGAADGLKVHLHALASKLPSVWRELRPGQWRGLVTQPTRPGQWWIVFAGLEREGDFADVYERLKALSLEELHGLYPNEDDFTLSRLEEAEKTHKAWLHSCSEAVLLGVEDAVGRNENIDISLPVHPSHTGAKFELSVNVERLEDQAEPQETPADILISFRTKNWLDATLRMSVLNLIVGLVDPVTEHWVALSDTGLDVSYLVQTTEVRLLQLQAAARLLGERTEPHGRQESFEAPRMAFAHYTSGKKLADAYVFGAVCQSLCGQWFVPTQDASQMAVCPDCSEIYETFV